MKNFKMSSNSFLTRGLSLLKTMFFLLAFVSIYQTSYAQLVGPGDWSSLRLYGHAYNVNGFTDTEYDFIADHNYLFAIEKRHARNIYGTPSSEIASGIAAQEIKTNNALTKPLFYWNSNVVYNTIYETIQDAVADDPSLVAANGNFNYENADFPDWWVSVAQDQVNNTVHDGVFIDACQNVEAVWGSDGMAILYNMLDQIPGLVIANGFWPSGNNLLAGPEMLDHVDGIFVESFFQHVLNTTAKGKVMLDALLEVPANKYIITSSTPDGEWANDHTFAMASFLIIANDYSFFHHFNGAYASSETQIWHDDFGEYIGAPTGVATVDGYKYSRTFANAIVNVDLENKTSSIVWGPTGTPVNGVSVTPSSTSLTVGGITSLSTAVSPSNATDQSLTWSSNNTSVATVNSSGLVTAIGAGSATITATTSDGGYTDGCSVTVTAGGGSINLALNGTATQSSTINDGVASRAIDGNTNGAWSGGSVTHTSSGTNAWWEVDLGAEYSIGDINILGRTDACCAARLSNYTVSVLDAAGTTVFTQDFTTYPTSSTNAGDLIGQRVRVQSNTTSALSLAEIQVFEGQSANLALSGIASQSTTAYGGEASYAIDGNTNGSYSGGSVTHTEAITNSWWRVNLGSDYSIDEIKIFNRTNACCTERLSNFTVFVIDAAGNYNFTQTYTTTPNPSLTIDLGGVTGKIVRIRSNLADTALALAEVEVYGSGSSSSACASFSAIEAEDFSIMSGVVDEGTHVGYIQNGDWAMYNNIDLTCATSIDVRTSSKNSGGNIEVRLGSPTGTLIGTVAVAGTGSWTTWETASANLSSVSGTNDVYLVFTGGSGYLFNLDWIEFSENTQSQKIKATKLGVDEISLDEDISDFGIYPNPTSGMLTIKFTAAETADMSIFDITGRTVLSNTISNGSSSIDTSSLPTGLYMIRISTENKTYTKKIIKR